jgi:hypothetical protein
MYKLLIFFIRGRLNSNYIKGNYRWPENMSLTLHNEFVIFEIDFFSFIIYKNDIIVNCVLKLLLQ